ncbi:Pre-rRNA-processing protein tsr2 [Picochlorum sp. SENEW3]|nr:Pre-rRNA-processing protein tsr2 [Picochlorum sp. SENEW3]
MASQGMILRNMNLVGSTSARIDMPEEYKKIFEEGCYLVFMRWTALQLAIHNEWGGSDSKEKAKALYEDVLDWFYTTKDHEMSDLEELLDEVIQVDFHVQAEDDSPYMVARSLVNMYNQVANGDSSYVDTLRQQHQDRAALDKSVRDPGASHGGDFMGDSSSSDDDEEEQGEEGSAEDVDMEEADAAPVVDEDGFQMVQRRRGRGQRHG